MKATLNITVLSNGFGWGGGVEFLRNITNALLSLREEQPLKLSLLLPVRNKLDSINNIARYLYDYSSSVIGSGKFSLPESAPMYDISIYDYFKNIDGNIELIEYNASSGLIPALRKIKSDVVLPAGISLGQEFPFPWVGYIYDFQHKYFPKYFTASEYLSRDINFARILRDSKAIIVNSHAVKNDINKFFPYHECKIYNLPFSASPVLSWLEDTDKASLRQYNLPPKYFLISNQFWVHKSHSDAFKALALLSREPDFKDIQLVCTGKMEDYRFPNHINDLMKQVEGLNLRGKVIFLGHIPKSDQIGIMKGALAVIQPTLFEGGPGGGALYDAISLGVPAIVSDISVNKELAKEDSVFYFKAGSPDCLAKEMLSFLKSKISHQKKSQLIFNGEERKKKLGKSLLEAARFAMDSSQ